MTKRKNEVPDQKVMSSSELDKYDYYMLNTEDKYYEVVESNTEDFMGPGEYVVEDVWEGIELESFRQTVLEEESGILIRKDSS